MGIIADMVTVATLVDAKRDKFVTAERGRRDQAAALFDRIADTLKETTRELRSSNYPHGTCAQMWQHADDLPNAVADELGSEYAKDMQNLLRRSYEVEQLFAELNQRPDREQQLATLDEAAGLFRADADYIRAT